MKKRVLSALTAFCLCLSSMPTIALPAKVFAANSDSSVDMSEMNALEAIGIDTSAVPDGYDANDTSNPYGKDVTTLNPVSELLMLQETKNVDDAELYVSFNLESTLYGHSDAALSTYDEFMSESNSKNNVLGYTDSYSYEGDFSGGSYVPSNYAYRNDGTQFTSSVAAGNFDGNTEGLEKQYALLTLNYDYGNYVEGTPTNLILEVVDACDGFDTSVIGSGANGEANFSIILIDNFSESFGNECDRIGYTYLIQNYVQIATGDFDGNGIDEIAVYVPDATNPRIEIYQYQQKTGASANAYQAVRSNWNIAWSYSIPKLGNNKDYIPNMVSLTPGDINEDGIEDLAITYSYYYSENNCDSGRAAVLFGDAENMLQDYYDFPLVSTSGDEIVRAAFAYGELTGVGTNTLVLGGQSLNDMKNGNIYSRYIALYQFNGDGFEIVFDQNFDLFSKDKNGNYTYSVMQRTGEDKDKFYSLPLSVANLSVISNGLTEAATLYYDSLYFTYGDSGLELTAAVDNTSNYQHTVTYNLLPANPNPLFKWNKTISRRFYIEYGAASADIFGLGYDAFATMQHYLPLSLDIAEQFEEERGCIGDVYSKMDLPPDSTAVTGETHFIMAYTESTDSGITSNTTSKKVCNSTSFAFVNTDHDTSYLKYTGDHYYTYSNPEILAVLASAPYFSDLLDRDDLSGNYAESTTSYGTTKGSGDGVTANASLFAGAYASFEHEIKVFGITIATIEASETITASFTYEFEKTSTLEQSIEYATSVGSDAVVLYSIPMVVYVYEAYTPDGNGGYDQQVMTITSPHTAVTQVMELDSYEKIAKDYAELPQISGNILTHTLGDPTTYPTDSKGYKNALVYDGDYSAVGYSGTGGGATVSQSISMTSEESHSFSGSTAIEVSAGVGAGGLVVGVTAGAEAGAGYVMTSTSGSTYTATMQNMPAEAEAYGYALSWKLFAYEQEYYDGKKMKTVPVVNYLVTNVEMPPELPEDFSQDVENTTDDTVALTWSYDKTVAGFQIYRYYEFPDGVGSYELAFVPFKDGVLQSDGTWQFSYEDENLSPYTDYYYQIQTVRAYVPNNSIESEVLVARTRTDVGYPEMTLSGLNENGQLNLYPDSTNTVTVTVKNSEDYPQGINYQWQKLEDGNWVDVNGKTSPAYTFLSSGYSTQGTYRCRVNVIYYDSSRGQEYLISAYSDTFDTVYSMHKVQIVSDFTADVDENGKPYASVSIASTTSNHNVAPTGTVTFEITGNDYSRTYTVSLTANGKTATANLSADVTSKLPEGVYTISASYNGSRVFLPLELGELQILSGESGRRLAVFDKDDNETDSVVYGDDWSMKVIEYSKDDNGKIVETIGYQFGSKECAEKSYVYEDFSYDDYIMLEKSMYFKFTCSDGDVFTSFVDRPYYYKGGFDDTETFYNTGELYNGGSRGRGYEWYAETPVNNYTLRLYYNTEHLAFDDSFNLYCDFSVIPRPITIGIKDNFTAAQGDVESNQPELYVKEGNLVYDDTLSDFVSLKSYDTAGREITLDNSTLPGSYTVMGYVDTSAIILFGDVNTRGDEIPSSLIDTDKYHADSYGDPNFYENELHHAPDACVTYSKCYDVTIEPATYIVTGEQYAVTAQVGTVNGKAAGTVEIITPQSVSQTDLNSGVKFGSGTSLTFLATPYEGYRVKNWTVTRGTTDPTVENGTNLTLSTTMLAETLNVKVEFELDKHTLTVVNNTSQGGSVKMPSGFGNGAVTLPGAEWTFTATAAEGYTFSHWEFVVGGSTTRYDDATLTVTMPNSDAYLYPIFVRDTYVLTLGENLRASYMWDDDNDVTTPDVIRYVYSGAKISGDTEVTILADLGYEIAQDAVWTVDGEVVENTDSTYTFTIVDDTQISANTVQGYYDITDYTKSDTEDEMGGVIIVQSPYMNWQGNDYEETMFDIPGTTPFTFTAEPNHGFVFDHFEVNGTVVDGTDPVYSISKLSEDITVVAVFVQNTRYTVSASLDLSLCESVNVQLFDEYGEMHLSRTYTSSATITDYVYDGDTYVVTVTPKSGAMVGNWTVNGTVYDSDHSKTKTFDDINDDITFGFDLVSQSYYTVNYGVVGTYAENEGGTIEFAKVNGTEFESGKNDVGGGSELSIKAAPKTGWMVKEWKINGETVTGEKGLTYQGNVLTIDALSCSEAIVDITVEFKASVFYVVAIQPDESWSYVTDSDITFQENAANVLEGTKIVLTVVPNENYKLDDVTLTGTNLSEITDNADGSKTITVYSLTDDLTISATTNRIYSITCNESTNGTVSAVANAAVNDTVTITAQPDSGYKLESISAVYTDGVGEHNLTISDDLTFVMPEGNVEITADFAQKVEGVDNYTITFDANGGTVTPISAKTDIIGNLSELPTPTRDGFSFVGWFAEIGGDTEITTDTVFTKNTTVYAKWTDEGQIGESTGILCASSTASIANCTVSASYNGTAFTLDISKYVTINSTYEIDGTLDMKSDSDADESISAFDIYWSAFEAGKPANKFSGEYVFDMANIDAVFADLSAKTGTTLTYADNFDLLLNVLYDEDGNALTVGTYEFLIAQLGDANLDHSVDAKDAAAIARYSSALSSGVSSDELPEFSEEYNDLGALVANVNSDISIDAKDAAMIAKYTSFTQGTAGDKYLSIWESFM